MKTFNLLLSVLLLSACASSQKLDAQRKKAEIYYNQGTKQLRQKSYADALKNLMQANKLAPKDVRILNNLAMAYYYKGAKSRTIDIFKRVLEIDPKNPNALNNLGTVYMSSSNFHLAKKYYEQLLKDLTYDGQYKTYYNLALIAFKTGEMTEAVKLFKQSLTENDKYCPAHYHLGQIYFNQNDYTSALDQFKAASYGTCYENPLPQYKTALTLMKMEDFNGAKNKLNDLIERFPLTEYERKARRQLKNLTQLENKAFKKHEGEFFNQRPVNSPHF